MANSTVQTLHTFLRRNDTTVSSGGTVVTYTHDHGSGPVLCMVHGWPQTSYMWRHVVPLVKDRISLAVVELPGYGTSSLPPKHDKRTVGGLIIEAVHAVFGISRPIIWCGHDRGGRVGHRLLVDNDPKHNITSAILLDIVPTLEQWRVFANPAAGAAYYHWPFLATSIAPQMIELMGGREFCLLNLERAKGQNAIGVAKLKENDAFEHYAHHFNRPETNIGACGDYAAGAGEDTEEQRADQDANRKIKTPTLVIYSASNLGRMHDVSRVWPQWADEGYVESIAVPDGIGHYIPEEAPERVGELIIGWLDRHAPV